MASEFLGGHYRLVIAAMRRVGLHLGDRLGERVGCGSIGCAAAHGREDGRAGRCSSLDCHPPTSCAPASSAAVRRPARCGRTGCGCRGWCCCSARPARSLRSGRQQEPTAGCGGGWLTTNGRSARSASLSAPHPVGTASTSSSESKSVRSASLIRGSGCPAYSSAMTRSNSPATIAGSATSGSSSVTSTRRSGCARPATSASLAAAPSPPFGTRPRAECRRSRRPTVTVRLRLARPARAALRRARPAARLARSGARGGRLAARAGERRSHAPGWPAAGKRRGTVGERLGDGGDGAPAAQLSQQAEAMEVKHGLTPDLSVLLHGRTHSSALDLWESSADRMTRDQHVPLAHGSPLGGTRWRRLGPRVPPRPRRLCPDPAGRRAHARARLGVGRCWSRTSPPAWACPRSRCWGPRGPATACSSSSRVPAWSPPLTATTGGPWLGWRAPSAYPRRCSSPTSCWRRRRR